MAFCFKVSSFISVDLYFDFNVTGNQAANQIYVLQKLIYSESCSMLLCLLFSFQEKDQEFTYVDVCLCERESLCKPID